MKKKISLVIIICILGVLTGKELWFNEKKDLKNKVEVIDQTIASSGLTREEKLEDFHYLYDILQDNYCYFDVQKRIQGYDWLSHKEDFMEMISGTENDAEFYSVINTIVEKLQQGHTNVLSPVTIPKYKQLYEKIKSSRYEPWCEILDSPLAEKSVTYWSDVLELEPPSSSEQKEIESTSSFSSAILAKDKIAYLKIGSFRDSFIEQDREPIYYFFETIQTYPYLIIDIRGNGGGSDTYWMENLVAPLIQEKLSVTNYLVFRKSEYIQPFIKAKLKGLYGQKRNTKYLVKKREYPPEILEDFGYYIDMTREISPKNNLNFTGKIFLLVDKGVFSSSESFANFAKASKWATLVGTPTGGDGIGFDPGIMILPHSGLIIRFPIDMGLNPDGTSNYEMKTQPDIQIDPQKEDALAKVLELVATN